MQEINRGTMRMRMISSVFLLMLLAVCGYVGSRPPKIKTASVQVVREEAEQEAYASMTIGQIRSRLEENRKEEMDLLQNVAEREDASDENRQNALAQQTQLANRMEVEAQIVAALGYMGYDRAAALCGAQSVMVFIPFDQIDNEQARVRIMDAAASAAGVNVQTVKIILVKK